MKTKELREKSSNELKDVLQSLRKDLFSLRMKKSTGQLRTTHELKLTKRAIARVMSLLTEKNQENA